MNGLVLVTVLLFVMLLLIGMVLFKEVRTHRFWRRLVADNDQGARNSRPGECVQYMLNERFSPCHGQHLGQVAIHPRALPGRQYNCSSCRH